MHFKSFREMSMIVSPLYKIIYSTLFFDRLCIIHIFFSFDDVIGTDFRLEGYTEIILLLLASAI